MTANDPRTCKCSTWGLVDPALIVFTKHHPSCEHATPFIEGVREFLGELIKGIDEWASYEDGIPDCLWDAYKKAVFITRGEVLSDDRN